MFDQPHTHPNMAEATRALLHKHLPAELVNKILFEHRGLASPVAALIGRHLASESCSPYPQDIYTAPSIGTMITDRLRSIDAVEPGVESLPHNNAIYLARRSAWFAPRLHAYMVPEHPGEILNPSRYGFHRGNRIPTHWGDVRAELVAENEWSGGVMG